MTRPWRFSRWQTKRRQKVRGGSGLAAATLGMVLPALLGCGCEPGEAGVVISRYYRQAAMAGWRFQWNGLSRFRSRRNTAGKAADSELISTGS